MQQVMEKQAVKAPKLRFREFEGEWKKFELGDISIKIGSGSTPRGGESVYTKDGVPFIRSQNVLDDNLVIDETCISREIHASMAGTAVRPKDILLNITGGSIGRSCVVPNGFIEGNVNQHVSIIRLQPNYSPKVVQAFLSSERGQNVIFNKQVGGNREALNFSGIRKISLHLPTLPEQEKIAAFLSLVDGRIAQLDRKRGLLEQYKRGMMQRLFSQQLRFKREDGSDYTDWEEKRLGEIYTYHTTNSFSREMLNYEEGEIHNIHYGDIHKKFKSAFVLDEEEVPFVNPDVDISRIKDGSYCRVGDVVIADASEDRADIGKAIEIVNLNGKRAVAGLHTFLARPRKGMISSGFGAYLFQSRDARYGIMRLAQGTKVYSISTSHLDTVKVQLPSLEEQHKIAGFLSALDRKISAVGSESAQMRQWKKGLLEGMFV